MSDQKKGQTMYVMVTVYVPNGNRDNAYDMANTMVDSVNGVMTSYDVSNPDDTFWSFGGDRIDQTDKV